MSEDNNDWQDISKAETNTPYELKLSLGDGGLETTAAPLVRGDDGAWRIGQMVFDAKDATAFRQFPQPKPHTEGE